MVKNFKLNSKFSAWKNQIPESQQNLPYTFEDKTNQDKTAKKTFWKIFKHPAITSHLSKMKSIGNLKRAGESQQKNMIICKRLKILNWI